MAKKIKENDLARAGMAKCPVQGCGRPFKPNENQKAVPPKEPPICGECMKFINRFIWCSLHVKVEIQKTPGGLVLPGNPQYKQTVDGQKLGGT